MESDVEPLAALQSASPAGGILELVCAGWASQGTSIVQGVKSDPTPTELLQVQAPPMIEAGVPGPT